MYKNPIIPLMITAFLTLNGCGGGGGSTSTTSAGGTSAGGGGTIIPNTPLPANAQNITINQAIQTVPLGNRSTRLNVNITNGPKNLYILLSNYATTAISQPVITHTPKIVSAMPPLQKKSAALTVKPKVHIVHAPKEVEAFRKNVATLLHKKSSVSTAQFKQMNTPLARQADVVGATQNFQLDQTAGVFTTATARKVVTFNTAAGLRTLNIWVSNDSFDAGAGCLKANCVTQPMVDSLAQQFLTPGFDNDIYDWVTTIFGAEWGADAQVIHPEVIPFDGNITILLTDIQNDNSTTGGVVGYFYGKDNLKTTIVSGSNQRVMFYMDSVLFATPSNGIWQPTDFWPQQLFSTLAHEFQHMIHFYQKTVRFNTNGSQTWLNEMLSETTEDVVATRLHNAGPRNVNYTDGTAGLPGNRGGRYPWFNLNNTLSLTSWSGLNADYSKVNAFGAFLVRNYGGPKLLHDIVINSATGTDAVVQAVQRTPQGAGKTFNDLLTEWGEAVLLSDQIAPVNLPTYNMGNFQTYTYGANGFPALTYQLGSINFFNYDDPTNPNPSPSLIPQTTMGSVEPQGNYYYQVGTGLSGLVHIDLLLNGITQATLIAK